MLVDVIFEKLLSYQVTVEVPDDATTEQVEEAAYKCPPDWFEEYSGIRKMEVVEPALERSDDAPHV
jgi:hypothetical protein